MRMVLRGSGSSSSSSSKISSLKSVPCLFLVCPTNCSCSTSASSLSLFQTRCHSITVDKAALSWSSVTQLNNSLGSNPHLNVPWGLFPVFLMAHINKMLNIFIGKFISNPGFIHLHFLFMLNNLSFVCWINVTKDHLSLESVGCVDIFETSNRRPPIYHELSCKTIFEASSFILQSLDQNSNPLCIFFGVVGVT